MKSQVEDLVSSYRSETAVWIKTVLLRDDLAAADKLQSINQEVLKKLLAAKAIAKGCDDKLSGLDLFAVQGVLNETIQLLLLSEDVRGGSTRIKGETGK